MKVSGLFVAAALTAGPVAAAALIPCEIVPKPPTFKCGGVGSIATPSEMGSTTKRTRNLCAASCMNDQGCTSFSYDASSKKCRRFNKSIIKQGFTKNIKSTESFWNRRCFQMVSSCPGGTMSMTTSTSSSSSSSSSPTGSLSPTDSSSSTPAPPNSASSTPPATPTRSIIDLPTETPAEVYNPVAPATYDNCLANPVSGGMTFKLMDPNDGIPIINNNGFAMKASEVVDPIPEFHFQPVEGADGVYDMMLNDQYLAVNLDGLAIFVSQSTGQKYVEDKDGAYITSLFSYSCQGELLTGLPGIVPFQFGFLDEDNQLYAQPIIEKYNPPPTSAGRLTKRIPDQATRAYIAQQRLRTAMRYMTPVCAPSTHNVPTGSASRQRCPNSPLGLQVFDKPGARPVVTNGCGSTGISSLVPNLDFGSCCDQHDTCYDTCSQGFDPCNNNFKSCNNAVCDAKYSGFFKSLARWGCHNLADFYAWSVSGNSGAEAYTRSTNDRCTCNCPFGQTDCNGRCIPVLEDPNNCGGCGIQCPSGECYSGACYVPPPPPPPPATLDPCDPDNAYDYYFDVDNTVSTTDGAEINLSLPWQTEDFPYNILPVKPIANSADGQRECCTLCYGNKNCLAYGLLALNTYGYLPPNNYMMCNIFYQITTAAPVPIDPPQPDTCPLGGSKLSFQGGIGTGTYSGVLTGKLNPGPCAPGF